MRGKKPADTVHPTVVVITALASNRTIYAQLAASAGRRIRVHTFTDIGDAIYWLDRHRTELVISDDHVSGVDGTDIVRQLTDRGANGRVPVVIITPYRDWLTQQRLLETGAIDVWRSPLDLPGCRARIRNLLRVAG